MSPQWRDDVRPEWTVTDRAEPDGWFYGVRHRDGKTVEGRDRGQLMARMVAADVVRTWNQTPEPELPAELA